MISRVNYKKKTVILITIKKKAFLSSILNLKNAKHLKKYKWTINANNVASKKMMGLVFAKRWEKKQKKTDFY